MAVILKLYNSAQENLHLPFPRVNWKHWIFFYIENHDRNRPPDGQLKEIKCNQSIHSAKGQGRQLEKRDLLGYCKHCLNDDYSHCINTVDVKEWECKVLDL